MRDIRDYLHFYLGCEAFEVIRGKRINKVVKIDCDRLQYALTRTCEYIPLLRSLSDMTEEEAIEFIHLKHKSILCNIDRTEITKVSFGETKNIINFSYFRRRGYEMCILVKSNSDNVLAGGYDNKSDREWSRKATKFIEAYERVNAYSFKSKTMRTAEEIETCDYCGNGYDSNSDGHEHFADSCECKHCDKSKDLAGKKFCSPECEYHYIIDNNLVNLS